MTNNISIYDTTLRDGNQAIGIGLSLSDKLEVAQKLDELGVHYIEGGWPNPTNEIDTRFYKEVKKLNLKAKIAAFGSTKRPNTKIEEDPFIADIAGANASVATIYGKSWDLHVTDVMGYPDEGPGGNFQGIRMYCAGDNKSGMLVHNDQHRGIEHCYVNKGSEPGDTYYAQPSPDYFKYISLGGEGLTPVGYGYRSIELIVKNACKAVDMDIVSRQQFLKQLDEEAVMATPKNSSYNELVMEAGRLSILNGGKEVEITYGENAGVKFKK